ncbi:hypothetical protein B0H19DRAFT_1264738 [Mycena capillaripes]|nr:hypothetical protein B0H19DRAFT_1264738 [Mycena capillaripes]
MLAMLPWGVCKAGVSDSAPSHTLWLLLEPHWLEGSQMNNMLELLRNKINADPQLVKNTRTWGTALAPKVLDASLAAEGGVYWTAPDMPRRWLRNVGDDLVQNATLVTSVHLGPVTDEPHWVTVIFDCCAKHVVRYGDSFKAPIPEELSAACHWWLAQHTPALAEDAELPVAR